MSERYGKSVLLEPMEYIKYQNRLLFYDTIDFCMPLSPLIELDERGLLRSF
jgi:hypothetical protein